MLKNTIRKLLVATGFLELLYCGAAVTMVFWPVPKFAHPFAFSLQTATQTQSVLVIVGSNDEAFYVDRFASVISMHQNSETVLLDGPTHDGIVHSAAALIAAADWIRHTRQPIPSAVAL
jgi:hypothetical protein